MKNLKLVLTAAMLLSFGTVICADKCVETVDTAKLEARRQNALEIKNEVSKQRSATDKSVKCKISKNEKFGAFMTRNEKGRGTSVKVYDLDTKELIVELVCDKELISGFTLSNEQIVVYSRGGFKSYPYNLVAPKCKKCKTQLSDKCEACGKSRIGNVKRARILWIIPGRKPAAAN